MQILKSAGGASDGSPSTEDVNQWAHEIGYAVARTAMYGTRHPASRAAIHIAFQESRRLLSLVKRLRCSLQEHQLIVHSTVVDAAVGDLLARYLRRSQVQGFELHEPFREPDFARFVRLLGDPKSEITHSGGLGNAIGVENIRCASPLPTATVRTATATEPQATPPPGPAAAPTPHQPPPAGQQPATEHLPRGKTPSSHRAASPSAGEAIELDTELTLEEVVASLQTPAAAPGSAGPTARPTTEWSRLDPQLARELMNAVRALQAGLRLHPATSADPLQGVRDRISATSRSAAAQLADLVRQLRADSAAVAQLEAEMASRGAPITLTRSRLMEQLAELIQEVLQPLTAASGVVDMLIGGHLGPVSTNQSELLSVAAESIQQVTTLARHMKELVGNPDGTTPDSAILKAAYARSPKAE